MMLGIIFSSVLLLLGLVKSNIPGVNVVSFSKIRATSSSPAVCASTDQEDVTSLDGQTLQQCSYR